jgi:D-glycero-alpha-D-manno-heptose-7-phosphate kinase
MLMIVTQTPLRISFLGGGTDFRGFYQREEGCVLSAAIDKYIFVIVKERFDEKIRVGYTRTERVDNLDDVQHDLVREALRLTGVTKKIEISTMGDIPSAGTGLGSSSTVTVGVLNALHLYVSEMRDAAALAGEACRIEIDILGRPIGKQDQYIVSYGGLRFIRFKPDGSVVVEKLGLSDTVLRRLSERLMLFYTGITRASSTVLKEQVSNIDDRFQVLCRMKQLAVEGKECLEREAFDEFGALLHQGWEYKKQLASGISNGQIDAMYQAARRAGAIGGKISGAGGGGFLLLYCPVEHQDDVRKALAPLRELSFALERDGSKAIFNYRR